MENYEVQAENFLQITGTKFESKFEKFDYHFADDKHKRNIFQITLSNNKHTYSFTFGSSLKDSLANSNDIIYEDTIDFYYALKFEGLKHEYLSYSEKIKISDIKEAGSFCRVLVNKKKATEIYNEFKAKNSSKHHTVNILPLNDRYGVEGWINRLEGAMIRKCSELAIINYGEAIQAKEIIHPTAYEVLAGLTKYEVGTFENFCSDFGYDTDSRKAEKIYQAVCKEYENISQLFNESELELMREIQ